MKLYKSCLTISALALACGLAQAYEPTDFEKNYLLFLIKDDALVGLRGGNSSINLKDYLNEYEAVDVKDVQAAYAKNELKGNKQYKGKELLITGTIKEIGEDIAHRPFISFKTKSTFPPVAYFYKSELDQLAELDKGQTVQAFCQVDNFIMQSVHFGNCLLASTVVENKVINPFIKEVYKCMEKKCESKIPAGLAVYVASLSDNLNEQEKAMILADKKKDQKKIKVAIDKAIKVGKPERMKQLGY